MNRPYPTMCPIFPFFLFPSHLCHNRALSRVLCATQEIIISYLSYIISIGYICQSQSPTSYPRFQVQYPYFYSLRLYFCFANKVVYFFFFVFICLPFILYSNWSISSVQFTRSVMSNSLQPHESQHARPPCPSPTPGVHSNSCPSSR